MFIKLIKDNSEYKLFNPWMNEVNVLNQCIVLFEDWQMQCCGTPFKVGDTVRWLVLKWFNKNIPVNVGTIDYYYEAHDSNYKTLFMLNGVVSDIRALHYKYEESSNNPNVKVPVSGLTVNVDSADGWDEPIEGLPFSEYIVKLEDVNIRDAKKSEVTFN